MADMQPPPRHRPPVWTPPVVGPIDTPRLHVRPRGPAGLDGAVLDVVDRHEGRPIGHVLIGDVDPRTADAELAHVEIQADHRRRGLGDEVVRHLLGTALGRSTTGGWGLNRVHMEAAGSDTAARGLARALGCRREVRRRQDRWVDGVGVDDTYGWAVLADEWDGPAGRMRRAIPDPDVGVGPHPGPVPDDAHLDPLLLRDGDRRNVADRYRYWRHERIVADLADRAHPFHVAIENWRHDSNIGTIVRNANAFGAAGVHVVGRRSWNRRGAMVTDRYMAVHHHDDAAGLATWAAAQDLPLIGVDNLPGSVSLHDNPPPRRCVLLMGQEGPGLSAGARQAVQAILHIPQYGSTRSINAGVASGIAMAAWVREHADPDGLA
jgi:tRNA G18 (ribose-2'-O)-methylase SpoU/RimJ/RimL family protein N-acetyltransferase